MKEILVKVIEAATIEKLLQTCRTGMQIMDADDRKNSLLGSDNLS